MVRRDLRNLVISRHEKLFVQNEQCRHSNDEYPIIQTTT